MTTNEFDIIDRYFKRLQSDSDSVVIGPGDDCAVLSVPAGEELCVSTDTLIEGVHFPVNSAPEVVIDRTMAANLSDLAAMGAAPFSFVLAITMPSADELWLEGCSAALAENIRKYGIPLVGGNLSKGSLSLTVTVMGTVPDGQAVTRSGASAGDEVYVTGSLGDAAMGLELLRSGKEGFLVQRYCSPTPRLEAGMALRGIASSMIDISDGLLAEIGHICEYHSLGAEIIVDTLPISDDLLSAAGEESATRLALHAGDDYELCFTAPADKCDEINAVSDLLDLPITRIGVITDVSGIRARRADGSPVPYFVSGYEHF